MRAASKSVSADEAVPLHEGKGEYAVGAALRDPFVQVEEADGLIGKGRAAGSVELGIARAKAETLAGRADLAMLRTLVRHALLRSSEP